MVKLGFTVTACQTERAMVLSLLFIVLRIPIWPRLAKYRATSRA